MHLFHSALAVIALGLVLVACEETDIGQLDTQANAPPFVRRVLVSADSVSIDTILTMTGTYSVAVTVGAEVDSPEGQSGIGTVSYRVFRPGAANSFLSGVLAYNASQSLYTADIAITLTRSEVGPYRIEVIAQDRTGLTSVAASRTLYIVKGNTPPMLGAPTLRWTTPPGSDSTLFTVSIAVTDSDGIGDVRSVFVRALGAVDSSARELFDNGLPQNGDAFPGDGVYSGIFWVRPAVSLPLLVLEFVAVDLRGGVSDTVQRSIQNSPPVMVEVLVPDSIQRPPTGVRPVLFRARVDDPDGLRDIDSVFFRNVSSLEPMNFLMFDDGNLSVSGDSTANDGIYTRIVIIDAQTAPGVREFHFHAVDRVGARDTVIRFITIY
jgi:hypothetical protein